MAAQKMNVHAMFLLQIQRPFIIYLKMDQVTWPDAAIRNGVKSLGIRPEHIKFWNCRGITLAAAFVEVVE